MEFSVTLVIIIITVLMSIRGFKNPAVIDELIFYPPAVSHRKQWYRFFSCGLIHADFGHLLFNMLALYFFGVFVEQIFIELFDRTAGIFLYLLLYASALFVSLLPTYMKHKDNYSYRSLGASGAVSAVVFAGLVLYPSSEIFIFFIPIPIPGFIFAPLYLLISFWLAKRGGDNINHSAHMWGSIYGALFVIVACLAIGFPLLDNFIWQVSSYLKTKGWMN